ncbi:muscarinic acetylcholine receptor M3-like [Lampris incognitus]|uniref:muscarinic acetylcholine receptor M3-like n=1 Tax=Lampris incognitus TaxID=2546036 RepID=UPI0024B63124|nr:muscarinic acetylcholine receptor M3-like [Lampris incognitus]
MAFATPTGLYQYTVLPFRVHGAPATFQRMMDRVLGPHWAYAAAYLDDIVIHSATRRGHLTHLRSVLGALRAAGLKANPQKCRLGVEEASYLGYRVKSFLGLVGYYQRFIPQYATLAGPLHNLTKKNLPDRVRWTREAEEAFTMLRQALCSDSVLVTSDFALPFVVQTDASAIGVGAVLSQVKDGEEHPVTYVSRKFLPHERAYSTVEKEALAIKWAVEKLRYYLLGRRFDLVTDHSLLRWMAAAKDTNERVTRSFLMLQDYSFRVVHRPGRENANADALSLRDACLWAIRGDPGFLLERGSCDNPVSPDCLLTTMSPNSRFAPSILFTNSSSGNPHHKSAMLSASVDMWQQHNDRNGSLMTGHRGNFTSLQVDDTLSLPKDTHDPLGGHAIWQVIIIVFLTGSLSLITVFGNILVLVSFKINKALKTVNNYYLLSLAFADLTIGTLSMNLYTTYIIMDQWALGPVVCDMWLAIDYVASNASVMNLLVISFDRYFSVTRPLTYRAKRTTKRAMTMIGLAWSISFILWAPAILFWQYIVGERTVQSNECYIQFLSEPIITFCTAIAAFYLPVTIMTVLYWKIYQETENRAKDLASLRGSGSDNSSNPSQNQGSCRGGGRCGGEKVMSCSQGESSSTLPQMDSSQSCSGCELNEPALRKSHQNRVRGGTRWGGFRFWVPREFRLSMLLPIHRSSKKSVTTTTTEVEAECSSSDSWNNIEAGASVDQSDSEGEGKGTTSTTEKWSSSTDKGQGGLKSNLASYLSADQSAAAITIKDAAMAKRFASKAKTQISKRKNEKKVNEKKAAQTLSAILFAFIITWTPYNIMVLVNTFCQDCIPETLWALGYWLCYVNSTVNPMCYALCNKTFRTTFRDIIMCQWAKKQKNKPRFQQRQAVVFRKKDVL